MDAPALWHTVPAERVVTLLNSSPAGLDAGEHDRRRATYGPNEIQAAGRVSPWAMLAEQFRNVLIVILLVATGLSAALGHGVEAIVIAIKEAAAMTLTDDNFASIVAAVEEGRGIFGNIKKYLMFLLSSNIGEIGLITATSLLGLPLPLSAVQILYVNLATDGLPALALAVDPAEPDLLERKPRDPRRGIFTRPVVTLMLIGGLWSTLVNAGLFAWALRSGRTLSEAMTMTFVSLVLIQFFNAYNYRSDRHSVLRRPFANRWLNMAIVWELALLAAVIYVPFMQTAFGSFSLTPADWLIVIGLSASISPVLELVNGCSGAAGLAPWTELKHAATAYCSWAGAASFKDIG